MSLFNRQLAAELVIREAIRKLQDCATGVGGHTFRHTVGTMLADMGEHQLTIRDYLLYPSQ